jgi:hypothetical protein
MGITIDGLGEVRILVPIDRAADARELLQVSSEDEGLQDDDQDAHPTDPQ